MTVKNLKVIFEESESKIGNMEELIKAVSQEDEQIFINMKYLLDKYSEETK